MFSPHSTAPCRRSCVRRSSRRRRRSVAATPAPRRGHASAPARDREALCRARRRSSFPAEDLTVRDRASVSVGRHPNARSRTLVRVGVGGLALEDRRDGDARDVRQLHDRLRRGRRAHRRDATGDEPVIARGIAPQLNTSPVVVRASVVFELTTNVFVNAEASSSARPARQRRETVPRHRGERASSIGSLPSKRACPS